MSSKYKAFGNVNIAQISPQRKKNDTYIAELIFMNQQTGGSMAQSVRDEIFTRRAAKLRRFGKMTEKYNLQGKYIFPSSQDYATMTTKIEQLMANAGVPVVGTLQIVNFFRSQIPRHVKVFSDLNVSNGLRFNTQELHTCPTTQVIGFYDTPGMDYLISSIYGLDGTLDEGSDCANIDTDTLELYLREPDLTVPSTVPYLPTSPSVSIPLGGSTEPFSSGFGIGYIDDSDGLYRFFHTMDPFFDVDYSDNLNVETFPFTAIQDNHNGELPYATSLPPESSVYIEKDKILNSIGVDFFQITQQLFGFVPLLGSTEWNNTYGFAWNASFSLQGRHPTEAIYRANLVQNYTVPAIGGQGWNLYRKSWILNMKKCCKEFSNTHSCPPGTYMAEATNEEKGFCDENQTETEYRDGIVADKVEARNSENDVTDAFVAMVVSPGTLAYENVTALLYTLIEPLSRSNAHVEIIQEGSVQDSDQWGFSQSHPSEKNTFSFEDGSMKCDYYFETYSLCVREGSANGMDIKRGTTGFRVVKKINTASISFSHGHYGEPIYNTGQTPYGTFYSEPSTSGVEYLNGSMLELRTQLSAIDVGGGVLKNTYIEMRIFDLSARQHVSVIHDHLTGKPKSALVVGSLRNFGDSEYRDVAIFPITIESAKMIKLFSRERLIRECLCNVICVIKVQEIKWYQSGFFKVIMIIASLIIAYFYPPLGISALKSVLATGALLVISNFILPKISNPVLRAILQIVLLVAGGWASLGNIASQAILVVEAAGIVLKTKLAIDAEELSKKQSELEDMINEKKKELKEMQDEAGMKEHDKSWLMYVASLAPVEEPDEFFDRTLDVGFSEVYLP